MKELGGSSVIVSEKMSTAGNPTSPPPPDRQLPSRWQALRFSGKTRVFQLKRLWENLANHAVRRHAPGSIEEDWHPVAESRSPLFREVSAAERRLETGKVRNLEVATGFLHGVVLGEGETFSFWAQIPRPTRRRGFIEGRELREGCIIPSVGGGLCQLSNALYDLALKAGFEVVERHAHSRVVPGSMAETGRDATVFWNYVDLRFRAPYHCQLTVDFADNEMIVGVRSREPVTVAVTAPAPVEGCTDDRDSAEVGSCETCGQTSCFRHRG